MCPGSIKISKSTYNCIYPSIWCSNGVCILPYSTDTGRMVVRTRAPFQYTIRRLTARSRKVSKPRDLYLELSYRSEIWQAPRQQGCRSACQISKRCDNLTNLAASILHEIYNKTSYRILKRDPGYRMSQLRTTERVLAHMLYDTSRDKAPKVLVNLILWYKFGYYTSIMTTITPRGQSVDSSHWIRVMYLSTSARISSLALITPLHRGCDLCASLVRPQNWPGRRWRQKGGRTVALVVQG